MELLDSECAILGTTNEIAARMGIARASIVRNTEESFKDGSFITHLFTGLTYDVAIVKGHGKHLKPTASTGGQTQGAISSYIYKVKSGEKSLNPTLCSHNIFFSFDRPLPEWYEDVFIKMDAIIDIHVKRNTVGEILGILLSTKNPQREMIEADILPHDCGVILSLLSMMR